MTRSWQYHGNSAAIVPEKDFKKLNALCVKKKAVKPKVPHLDQRRPFAKCARRRISS